MYRLKFLAIITLNIFAICDAQAEISYAPAHKTSTGGVAAKIRIYGEITRGDTEQFHLLKDAALSSARSIGLPGSDGGPFDEGPFIVELDSYGGSVVAAIEIGKEIRKAKPWSVTVASSASCVSSCVLILAGGTTRFVQGRVGIHRPFIDADSAFTAESQKQNYAEIERMVKDYLAYVNVPTSLYDVMFRIPPEKMRYLSRTELQEFNLSEDDPYLKEARDAKNASDAGLSKSEYQKRMAECAGLPNDDAETACYAKLFRLRRP